MFVLFPDWHCRRWALWIRKCPHWVGNNLFVAFQLLIIDRAALRADAEITVPPLSVYPGILSRPSSELDIFSAKSGLSAKDAARSPLTIKAVANRYANRVFGCDCRKLPATTCCSSSSH